MVKQLVPDAVYIYLAEKQIIGAKRNLACEAARGEVICHFDDDDWSAAGRIRDQVTRLLESGKQMTGYHSITYWNGTKAYHYRGTGKAKREGTNEGTENGTQELSTTHRSNSVEGYVSEKNRARSQTR